MAGPEADGQEAVKFLERDFNQCFTQMRHYDSQIWDICKFTFTAYTVLLGVAVGLYKYSTDKGLGLLPAVVAILGVGMVVGVFAFSLTIRNRVYFVVLSRYINEHRRLFLKQKPLGFENVSGMYTNPARPAFFHWRSVHAWLSCIIASLNSVLAGALALTVFDGHKLRWLATVLAFAILLGGQVGVGIWHLRSREKKSGSAAVFGQE